MQERADQINEVLLAHEHLAPDAESVLAEVNGRVKAARRRQLAVRATGVSVLGAGIVAAGVNVPAWLHHSPVRNAKQISVLDDPAPTPSPTASFTDAEALSEYFAKGYDYTNEQQLASMWNETGIEQIKTEAGMKLLEGQSLGITPDGTPESLDYQEQDMFLAAGYDYTDAQTLGQMWNEPNTSVEQLKAQGGAKLLAGQTLPIKPSGGGDDTITNVGRGPVESPGGTVIAENPDVAEFFAKGYGYNDAVALAQKWNETDTYQVKIQAGQKLLAGQTLPVSPTGN